MINCHLFKILTVITVSSLFLTSVQADESSKLPDLKRNADGIAVIESGNIQLPSPASNKKLWIGFMAKDGLSRETTNRLQEVFEKLGFKVTNNKELAAIRLEVAGLARIRNEAENSFDTGSVMIKDITTTGLIMDTIVYGNSTAEYHADRPEDLGIADGATKLIRQAGGSDSIGLAGLGVAWGINKVIQIFEKSPDAKNVPFQNIVGDKGSRPLICFDACRRTHHEVILNVLMPAQENLASQHYSVHVDKLATSVDEDGMHKLASMAFDMLAKHLAASAPPATGLNASATP